MNYREYAKMIVDNRFDIKAAYGYGSAFFNQAGYTYNTKKSLDMIFVVDDIKKWNRMNFKLHPNDYTMYTKTLFNVLPKQLLTSGTSIIYNVIQDKYKLDFKYGLIEKEQLINDLKKWEHFYVCGRMQKPLYSLKNDKDVDAAIKNNRESALLLSLLILNQDIVSLEDLFEQIVSLSYTGDIRTICIENPHKIKNIVQGNYEEFKKIYCSSEYLSVLGDIAFVNLDQVYDDIKYLPLDILRNIDNEYYYSERIKEILKHKNLKESIIHPIKQFTVTGLHTCKKYLKEKINKKNIR